MPKLPVLSRLILVAATALPAIGCGIEFGEGEAHHEPLDDFSVSDDMKAGEELRLELKYSQTYPVDVAVECRLKQGSNVVQIIGSSTIPANPEGGPEATPVTGSLNFSFEVDIPGEYRVECLTPADEENKIKKTITVRP